MIKCAMKCGFGFFIAPPISQIATNQKIAIVVNKNAHGEQEHTLRRIPIDKRIRLEITCRIRIYISPFFLDSVVEICLKVSGIGRAQDPTSLALFIFVNKGARRSPICCSLTLPPGGVIYSTASLTLSSTIVNT